MEFRLFIFLFFLLAAGCQSTKEIPVETGSRDLPGIPVAALSSQKEAMAQLATEVLLPEITVSLLGSPDKPCCDMIRAFGQFLEAHIFSGELSVQETVYANELYWLAMLQMHPTDERIAAIPVLLYLQEEELDRAMRMLSMLVPFIDPAVNDEENFVAQGMLRLHEMGNLFFSRFDREIKTCRRLHDEGDYERARSRLATLLQIHPHSVIGQYSYWFTDRVMEPEAYLEIDPQEIRDRIQEKDPFLPMPAVLGGFEPPEERFLRRELSRLLANEPSAETLYTRFAEIALRLGEHGMAAIMYWKIALYFPEGHSERDQAVPRFLYCMQELGHDRVLAHFRPDMVAKADEVRAWLRK